MHSKLLKLSLVAVTAFVAVSASASDTGTSCNNQKNVGRYAKTAYTKEKSQSGKAEKAEAKSTKGQR